MTEINDLRRRLETVEAKVEQLAQDGATTRTMVAMADRDVADFKLTLQGHTRVLNALRETQREQGRILLEHGEALGALVTGQIHTNERLDRHGDLLTNHTQTLEQHTRVLDGHTKTLDQHTKTLDQHTKTLDQHTKTLDQHTQILGRHGASLDTLVAGQAVIMRHLGITDNGAFEPGGA